MRLKVKSFASLSDIDVILSDYTIFIGEQASGKSITCKLYFLLRESISNKLVKILIEELGWKSFISGIKEDFYSIFPEYSWKDSDFYICLYENENSDSELLKIEYKKGRKSINIEFSEGYKNNYKLLKLKFDKLKKEALKAKENKIEEFPKFERELNTYSIFRKAYEEFGNKKYLEDVTYIPSGRAFFSVIRDNVFGFLSENIGIDPFLKSFGKFYEFAKHLNTIRRPTKNSDLLLFDEISSSVLKGEFKIEKKEEWLISGSRKIQVANASSGQQEALPLVLVLRSLMQGNVGLGGKTVIVEEPEAHLFPTSQKAIVELIFLPRKQASNVKFIITTHSPYVLSCVNNEVLKFHKEKKSTLSSYYLSNGKSYKITDDFTGLINGEELDRVSEVISKEFYSMLGSLND